MITTQPSGLLPLSNHYITGGKKFNKIDDRITKRERSWGFVTEVFVFFFLWVPHRTNVKDIFIIIEQMGKRSHKKRNTIPAVVQLLSPTILP